jgi:hypothetical protein
MLIENLCLVFCGFLTWFFEGFFFDFWRIFASFYFDFSGLVIVMTVSFHLMTARLHLFIKQ